MMSFERLENYHIVCAENNQRAHCRLKGKLAQSHTIINSTAVGMVSSTKFQRVQITDTLSWSLHTRAVAKRAPEFLYFLSWTRRGHLPSRILTNFYKGTIEGLLTWISVWSGACSAANWKSLQRGLKTTEKITESPLPHFQDIAVKCSLIRTNVSLLFHIPTMLCSPCLHLGEGSAGSAAEQQHLHYPCYWAVTNPHHHHPGPYPQPPKTIISDVHTYISHWSVNWTTLYLMSYLHICYFGHSIIKWIFFPFYLTKGWTVKY